LARTDTPPRCKLSKWEKQRLQQQAEQFLAEVYKPAIKPPPRTLIQLHRGLLDQVHGAYLQFIAKYACPGPNALSPFFEIAFARLGYFGPDSWNIWARRHNDQWLVLGSRMTLRECFDEMRTNPWFER